MIASGKFYWRMFKKLKQKIESESEGEQSPASRNERSKRRSNEVRSRIWLFTFSNLYYNCEGFIVFDKYWALLYRIYICLLFIKGTSTVKKAEESPVVSPEKQSELTPDRSSSVEQPNTTPTSQHVIARVHQLLEVNMA